MAISLGDLATQFGCELIGDADVLVDNVASLNNANSSSLSFLANPAFKDQLASTAAAAVILGADDAENSPTASLKILTRVLHECRARLFRRGLSSRAFIQGRMSRRRQP